MAAARPIVVAAHPASEAALLVDAAGCGVCVSPNAPAALAQAIASLAGDVEKRTALGARGRAYAENNFARATALRAFETALLD